MKAYKSKLLENTFLVEEAKSLRNGKFISADQYFVIKTKYEQLKTQPNILVRAGFFLLGIFLYSSIAGAIALVLSPIWDSGDFSFTAIIWFYAVIGLVASEFFAKNNYYNFGLDDVFVLGFQAMLYTAIGVSTENKMLVLVVMAVVGTLSCVRYINTLSALVALVGISGIIAVSIADYGVIPTAFLPFVMLLLAGFLYWIFTILKKHPKAYFYQYALQLLQVFSLILGYASVNYLVVRELSAELLGIEVKPGEDIPFAFLFYALTFLIPVGYIALSLKKKSREFLIVGLLAFAFSIFTIRFYYSLMPIETALILGGILLFGIACFGIAKLKHKESGVTFKTDRNTDKNSLMYAQAIIINSQLHSHQTVSEDPMQFGGGGFSGGGAGESY